MENIFGGFKSETFALKLGDSFCVRFEALYAKGDYLEICYNWDYLLRFFFFIAFIHPFLDVGRV